MRLRMSCAPLQTGLGLSFKVRLSADRATASPRVNQPSITVGRCPVGSCDMLGVPMATLRLPAVVGSVFVSVVLLVASSSSMHASIMHTQAPGSVKFRRKVSGNANAVNRHKYTYHTTTTAVQPLPPTPHRLCRTLRNPLHSPL